MKIKDYVKTVLEECPDGSISFDIGVSIDILYHFVTVDDASPNRIRFTIIKKTKRENKSAQVRGT